MADEFTKNLLRGLDIDEDTIKLFEEEGIDQESVLLLTDSHLEKFLPKSLGKRLKLLNKIKNMKINQDASSSGSDSTLSIGSIDSAQIDQLLMPPPSNLDGAIFLDGSFLEDLENTIPPKKPHLECINILELVNSSKIFQCILKQYTDTGVLDRSKRDKITEIILEKVLDENPNEKITRTTFEYLAKGIKEIFPTENLEYCNRY